MNKLLQPHPYERNVRRLREIYEHAQHEGLEYPILLDIAQFLEEVKEEVQWLKGAL